MNKWKNKIIQNRETIEVILVFFSFIIFMFGVFLCGIRFANDSYYQYYFYNHIGNIICFIAMLIILICFSIEIFIIDKGDNNE